MSQATKVLIIDDSRTMRSVVKVYLVGKGYEFLEAPDGAAGLKMVSTERPDVVVTDIRMNPVDGYELCKRIRATPGYRQIGVILMTGTSEKTTPEQSRACGADGLLLKPIDPDNLLREVERVHTKRKGGAV